ncbi:MAG: T9SS type A sorting domain-containing protein, partial [candidate division WOR-3 bacterium]
AIAVHPNSGDVVVTGRTFSAPSYYDWGTVKFKNLVGVKEYKINQKSMVAFEVAPNPFRNCLVIKFQIPSTKSQIAPNFLISNVGQGFSLAIYDVTGRMVKDFSRLTVKGERSTVVWEAKDGSGRKLPVGVYFVRLQYGEYRLVEKVVLLK